MIVAFVVLACFGGLGVARMGNVLTINERKKTRITSPIQTTHRARGGRNGKTIKRIGAGAAYVIRPMFVPIMYRIKVVRLKVVCLRTCKFFKMGLYNAILSICTVVKNVSGDMKKRRNSGTKHEPLKNFDQSKGGDLMRKTSDAQMKAVKAYKEKVKRLTIDFAPTEMDLYEQVAKQPKKQTYIKNLIRADMERE